MALPVPPNITCDIYRLGNTPPAASDVAAVTGYLRPDWRGGQEHGDRSGVLDPIVWTHVMLVASRVDIRDAYAGAMSRAEQDTIYIPDKNGTPFKVTFVERVDRKEATEHKRVYLDRQSPGWPTDEL